MPQNRLLLVLAAIGLAAALLLAFLSVAPNRLTSGAPLTLSGAVHGLPGLALLPGAALAGLAFAPPSRRTQWATLACASLFLAGLVWLAGNQAAIVSATRPAAVRVGLGGGFWVLFGVTALVVAETLRGLSASPLARTAAAIAALGPVVAVIGGGLADHLGIMREYAAGRGVFAAAVLRHGELVLAALAPTLAIGLPLGLLAARRPGWRAPLFGALNVIQTIPAIAMFGLLMAPFAAAARLIPSLAALGVSGIGMAPAVVALMLYGLLPIARNTEAGFASVAPAVLETARGMGMTGRQILLRVELPLALPVFLAGVRITLVQLIGLTVLAALIGAGGLGAIMFQGLFADALDQVLLGVIPVVLLAIAADGAVAVLIALARPAQ